MNKYQEALDKIVENSCPQKTNCRVCKIKKSCNASAKECVDKLQELVDKATPKKPCFDELYKDEETTSIYDENRWIDPILCICPNCGKKAIHDFEYDENFKHCTNCGQAIDWSDEE